MKTILCTGTDSRINVRGLWSELFLKMYLFCINMILLWEIFAGCTPVSYCVCNYTVLLDNVGPDKNNWYLLWSALYIFPKNTAAHKHLHGSSFTLVDNKSFKENKTNPALLSFLHATSEEAIFSSIWESIQHKIGWCTTTSLARLKCYKANKGLRNTGLDLLHGWNIVGLWSEQNPWLHRPTSPKSEHQHWKPHHNRKRDHQWGSYQQASPAAAEAEPGWEGQEKVGLVVECRALLAPQWMVCGSHLLPPCKDSLACDQFCSFSTQPQSFKKSQSNFQVNSFLFVCFCSAVGCLITMEVIVLGWYANAKWVNSVFFHLWT